MRTERRWWQDWRALVGGGLTVILSGVSWNTVDAQRAKREIRSLERRVHALENLSGLREGARREQAH